MLRRIASTLDPNLVAGQQVSSQNWTRDGGAPSGTGLTNGLSFVVCPGAEPAVAGADGRWTSRDEDRRAGGRSADRSARMCAGRTPRERDRAAVLRTRS